MEPLPHPAQVVSTLPAGPKPEEPPPAVMRCLRVPELPAGPEWIYEMMVPGARVTVRMTGGGFQWRTDAGKAVAADVSGIESALRGLASQEWLLDAVLQTGGCGGAEAGSARLVVLDLIERDGRYLAGLPYRQRKLQMEALLRPGAGEGRVTRPEELVGCASDMLRRARRAGACGVVAKDAGSTYEEGRRDGAWMKCLLEGRIARPTSSRGHRWERSTADAPPAAKAA